MGQGPEFCQADKGEEFMRKKGLVILLLLAMIGVSGCGLSLSSPSRKIESYLKNKYNSNFYLVSRDGYDVRAHETNYTYKDEDGNEFNIRYDKDYISDNYGHILYDVEIQDKLQLILGENYKVFVSTEMTFWSGAREISNFERYMEQLTFIKIHVYTLQEPDYQQIAETLLSEANGITFLVDVYHTTKSGYDSMTKYSDKLSFENELSRDSFMIEEDQIKEY